MRFSIRTLLALMVVAALAMVLWQTRQEALVQQRTAMQLAMEIDSLSAKLYLDREDLQTAITAEADLYASLQENRERSEQTIAALVEKYGGVEDRGEATVAIRVIPTIRSDSTRTPLAFRLLIPDQRSVWLKFGIHRPNVDSPADGLTGSEQGLLTKSPFEPTGPFEIELTSGVHRLEFTVFEQERGIASIQLKLNDKVLASYRSSDDSELRNSGHSHIAAYEQVDYPSKRSLPSFTTYRVKVVAREDQQEEFKLSGWLSDQSSSFAPFPGP